MKTTMAALAALALVAPAAPALASDAPSVKVIYDDLNLESASGQKRLENRIEKAARAVCGYQRQRVGTRIADSKARDCFERAKAQAHASVAAAQDASALGG